MSADSDAMKQAIIPYPAGLPQMLKLSDGEFARELRFLTAAKLYELGRLSSGIAARLAGLERMAFLYELGRTPPSTSSVDSPKPNAPLQPRKGRGRKAWQGFRRGEDACSWG